MKKIVDLRIKIANILGYETYADYALEERMAKSKTTVNEFIKNYPLPTSKEDMLEFIASLDARRRSKSHYQEAYNAKYQECVTKAKILFASDSDLTALLSQTEKGYLAYNLKAFVIKHKKTIFIVVIVLALLQGFITCINSHDAPLNWDDVSEAIKEQDTEDVINLIGTKFESTIEDHKGEIQVYMQHLIKEGKIEEAKDLGDAVKLAAPKSFITKPLYDYYINQGDATNAEKYDAPIDGTDFDANSEENGSSEDDNVSE